MIRISRDLCVSPGASGIRVILHDGVNYILVSKLEMKKLFPIFQRFLETGELKEEVTSKELDEACLKLRGNPQPDYMIIDRELAEELTKEAPLTLKEAIEILEENHESLSLVTGNGIRTIWAEMLLKLEQELLSLRKKQEERKRPKGV